MKKIAILRCLESNDVCTGASCLDAFQSRSKYFSNYDENVKLVAFFSCNGCEQRVSLKNQLGMKEKLERLQLMGTEVVHVGSCVWIKNKDGEQVICTQIIDLIKRIKGMGMDVVYGTH